MNGMILQDSLNLKKIWGTGSRATDPTATYNLDDSVLNYKAIVIVFRTNDEFCSELIPKQTLDSVVGNSNKHIAKFLWLHSNQGQQATPWAYAANCLVIFPTATTFKVLLTYTNANLILGVFEIYGIM